MILVRAVRRFGGPRPVDAIPAAELRAWLLELRSSLAPEPIAGYVRGLKAFGNWCVAEELAGAPSFRALRRPHVPLRLIAPFSDAELRGLLALGDERERALVLLLLDTGLRRPSWPPSGSATSVRTERFMSWARRQGADRPDRNDSAAGKRPVSGRQYALQSAHVSAHIRSGLPRQRRRRIQPPADPRSSFVNKIFRDHN
jgi:hypothetical protein